MLHNGGERGRGSSNTESGSFPYANSHISNNGPVKEVPLTRPARRGGASWMEIWSFSILTMLICAAVCALVTCIMAASYK